MTILAIDDDQTQIELLRTFVSSFDYPTIEYLSAISVEEGLRIVSEQVIDLILCDLYLPDGTGFDVLAKAKHLSPVIAIVIMTSYANTGEAVRLLKGGADDYLVKPTKVDAIERIILRINEKLALQRESLLPPVEGPASSIAVTGIIYKSEAMAEALSIATRAATSSATVLLMGESGTGKELVARFIHERSGRSGAFVAVSISALSESLIESELFGHSKGAFTDASSDRIGRFEEADGGTLFLDEIGEISAMLQVKLLRVLQFGQIQRIGENRTRNLDVRIISATNKNLARMVEENSFRRDLYYRLNVIEINISPLRDRKEDIRFLVDHFIETYSGRGGKNIKGITREALDRLYQHSFPGNVRELENAIERAIVLCRGEFIRVQDLPLTMTGGADPATTDARPSASDYKAAMHDFESKLIEQALLRSTGNQSAAARELGITERHLRSCLSRLAGGKVDSAKDAP
ncbi:MAG: sigma-54 dependent transcriptional regulator [Spirochaetota bacterium]